MRIGEVAEIVGLPTRTIRFYERRKLLPDPARSANGYRVYDDAAIDRLRFIQSAQAAGLTLAEIGNVIVVRDSGEAPCSHVGELLSSKLAEVQRRREELTSLEAQLEQLLERGRELDPADCTEEDVCHILRTGHH